MWGAPEEIFGAMDVLTVLAGNGGLLIERSRKQSSARTVRKTEFLFFGRGYIIASEAVRRLRVGVRRISLLLRQGLLAGFKVQNRWLVDEVSLKEYQRKKFRERLIVKSGRPSSEG